MKNTMTYAVALTNAIALTDGETKETLTKLLNSINKRNARKSTSDKPTKKQVENEGVKASIMETLRNAVEPMTCKGVAEAMNLSVQKVNALLKQMILAGIVVRTEGKKKVALFALANSNEDEGE